MRCMNVNEDIEKSNKSLLVFGYRMALFMDIDVQSCVIYAGSLFDRISATGISLGKRSQLDATG